MCRKPLQRALKTARKGGVLATGAAEHTSAAIAQRQCLTSAAIGNSPNGSERDGSACSLAVRSSTVKRVAALLCTLPLCYFLIWKEFSAAGTRRG